MSDLAINRGLTQAFIDRYPVTLVLTPRTRVQTVGGGFAWQEETPRDPQVMTLIEQSSLPLPTVTLDGVVRVVELELLGMYDAAMAVGDVFTHQGKGWEILSLAYDNGYERRALVSARG